MVSPEYGEAAKAPDDVLEGGDGANSTADFMPTGILPGGMEPGTGGIPDDAQIFIPERILSLAVELSERASWVLNEEIEVQVRRRAERC